jgi:hypothetical protein
MLQFNNNHIFTGYLKQFLSSFNLPTCRIYTAEFAKYYSEHGCEDPRVIESTAPIALSSIDSDKTRPAMDIMYLKEGDIQQYFWDTSSCKTAASIRRTNNTTKYWKIGKSIHYSGNKIPGLTKTLKNPTTLYNYQTHEYLGDYLRFLRDYEGINLMSMYNCFSNRLCNNIQTELEWKKDDAIIKTVKINAYDTNFKIYMLPAKLFENYTVAIDCYQGVEMFCGFYDEKLDASSKASFLMKQTYVKVPKALFNQPFIYDKLDVKNWSFEGVTEYISDENKILRSEIANRENNLKLFIKVPATNTSSITVLAGDYRNYNDAIYTRNDTEGWQYKANSSVANFETTKTFKKSTLPDLNDREFKPISKLQLLALNTGISYPFADRLIEYLVANAILPNDTTPDNIRRLQKVMEDCGYSFQVNGAWEPKMQMVLYDYLMNSGKFAVKEKSDARGKPITRARDCRKGNLRQAGQGKRSEFYDILGYVDKDAEKLYASWEVETNPKTGRKQVTAKSTLENVDIYSNLYNN